MASLHPLVYVIAGSIVTVVSATIGDSFKLFFYIGVGLLVFGVVSAFIGAMQYRGAQKTIEKHSDNAKKEVMQKYPGFLPEQRAQQAQIAAAQKQARAQAHAIGRGHYKFCRRCGTMARHGDAFCSRCGLRV